MIFGDLFFDMVWIFGEKDFFDRELCFIVKVPWGWCVGETIIPHQQNVSPYQRNQSDSIDNLGFYLR